MGAKKWFNGFNRGIVTKFGYETSLLSLMKNTLYKTIRTTCSRELQYFLRFGKASGRHLQKELLE